MRKKQITPKAHKWDSENYSCIECGGLFEFEANEPCEEEDLSMWCTPGQSVSEMLELQSAKDKS